MPSSSSIVPPKSQSTTSPSRITRSPGSWCGLAALAPAATMAKFTRWWPSARSRRPSSADTWASVRPTSVDVAALELGRHPIGGRPGPAQRLDLGGVLAGSQRADDVVAPGEPGGRERGLEVDEEASPGAIADGQRGGRRRPARPRWRWGRRSRPRPAARTPRGAPRLGAPRGAGRRASPPRRPGSTSIVRRSSGMASYPVRYGRSGPTDRRTASTPSSAMRARTRSARSRNMAPTLPTAPRPARVSARAPRRSIRWSRRPASIGRPAKTVHVSMPRRADRSWSCSAISSAVPSSRNGEASTSSWVRGSAVAPLGRAAPRRPPADRRSPGRAARGPGTASGSASVARQLADEDPGARRSASSLKWVSFEAPSTWEKPVSPTMSAWRAATRSTAREPPPTSSGTAMGRGRGSRELGEVEARTRWW